jgi:UDPglucose 6-dehydrogenase
MEQIHKSMKQPVVIDGRNLYEPEMMTEHGFTYRGLGRGYNGASIAELASNGRAGTTESS